jgi:hypothetical protein
VCPCLDDTKNFDTDEIWDALVAIERFSDFGFAANAKIGTGTDQKYAKVRVLFTLNNYAQLRFFKDLREGMLVRDEGVAGSNPALRPAPHKRCCKPASSCKH